MLKIHFDSHIADRPDDSRRNRRKGLFHRFVRNEDGTSAIEFSLLALPFLIVLFASLETFFAFAGEQLLANATETLSRKVRTGEITSTTSQEDFRKLFCDEISIIMTCSATEAKTADRLFVDVRSYTKFSDIPTTIPRKSGSTGDFDPTGFAFTPGGPNTINMVRAYYRWEVMTDLIRPYITNLRSAGSSMPNDYLMVATSAFRNENF